MILHSEYFHFIVSFSLVWLVQMTNGGKRQVGVQKSMPEDMDYPCPDRTLWRSKSPPNSVHQLKPGDIDVIAAIGDSLTAGNGAMTDNLYEVLFVDNRGVSWSIGGQGTWRQYLTVPNLLKVMNPKLVGYSLGDGNSFRDVSQLNVAFNGAMDQDLMGEAMRLVNKMKTDPRVDYNNHWKMVTIMIGTNDICSDQCYSKEEGPETHRKNLIKVIDYLYQQMPRTFVNLVSMPYIPSYADLVNPPYATCITMKLVACSCLFGGIAKNEKLSTVKNLTRQFQQIQKSLAESGRYDSRDDFTVVFQPTHQDSTFPKLNRPSKVAEKRGDPHDYSYIAIDCIHFSQKLHAVAANTLWNNLYQTPKNKTTEWIVPAYKELLCPSAASPYLITYKNYKNSDRR